jgi:hypothetical protein
VNFDQIRRLDKKLWDRKGIAYVDYEVDGASELRRFRLDDFVYERKPTDQIYDRINAYVSAQQGPSDEPGEPENEDSGGSSQIG